MREYDGALEAALTSDLNTEIIDVTDPLRIIRYHHLQLPIIIIVVSSIIIGSFCGVIYHYMTSNKKSTKSPSSPPSQFTFPDDGSTTDKSETLSFRSLDFRTSDEQSIDLQEVTSIRPPNTPELQHA